LGSFFLENRRAPQKEVRLAEVVDGEPLRVVP
jgi:hypothetical protein